MNQGIYTIALAGNPNCGKTTLFNRLTGSNQHVGNFPGVTVEKKSGTLKGHPSCVVVDLPGIYSLSPYSGEEFITRDFIINTMPDCIINIVDASNLERSLLLTVQLLKLNIPIVLALNMIDEVRSNGININYELLENEFGVAVTAVSAAKNEGIDTLVNLSLKSKIPNIRDTVSDDYKYIEKLCSRTVSKLTYSREYLLSVKVDKILTHKYLGIPIFVIIMGLIFWLTFSVIGKTLSNLLKALISVITESVNVLLVSVNLTEALRSLIVEGVYVGVGSVLSFLPMISLLFFFMSILEDSGYMARVAFIMDKPLSKIGLSGHSFIALLLGLGCSVPAIMSSRNLSSRRERQRAIMLIPFISCSAKIPIYVMFTSTFFPKHSIIVMLWLYLFGITVGVLCAYMFKGEPAPFMLELPNYRMPSLRSIGKLIFSRAKDFTVKAFTVILISSVVIWFFRCFDLNLNFVTDAGVSMLSKFGSYISVIFKPLGFGDWRIATALVTGFTSKEAVLSTLAVLTDDLKSMFKISSALSFLTFTLLYTPCIAAIAAVKRELNSGIKAFYIVIFQCSAAWISAFLVYSIASFIERIV